MDNLWNQYQKTLAEIKWISLAIDEGRILQEKKLKDIETKCANRGNIIDEDRYPKSTQRVYCYGITLYAAVLEVMIKEYAIFYASSEKCIKERGSRSPIEWQRNTSDELVLTPDRWCYYIKRRLKDVKLTDCNDGVNVDMLENSKARIMWASTEFEDWWVLYKSVTIRNLTLHNNGRMNKQTYKIAPICAIGVEPPVDKKLLDDLSSALDLFNNHLAAS
jgi:hypothetical protein